VATNTSVMSLPDPAENFRRTPVSLSAQTVEDAALATRRKIAPRTPVMSEAFTVTHVASRPAIDSEVVWPLRADDEPSAAIAFAASSMTDFAASADRCPAEPRSRHVAVEVVPSQEIVVEPVLMKRLLPAVTISLPVPSWAMVRVSPSEVLYVTLNAEVFDFATSDEKSEPLFTVVVDPEPEALGLLLPQAARPRATVATAAPITNLDISASGGRTSTARRVRT